jgi:hypothetical protein
MNNIISLFFAPFKCLVPETYIFFWALYRYQRAGGKKRKRADYPAASIVFYYVYTIHLLSRWLWKQCRVKYFFYKADLAADGTPARVLPLVGGVLHAGGHQAVATQQVPLQALKYNNIVPVPPNYQCSETLVWYRDLWIRIRPFTRWTLQKIVYVP